jgi:predicted MFS family arabinose efflux permease
MLICQIAGVVGLVAMALINPSPAGMVMAMIWGILSSVALPLETIMLSLITTDLFGNKAFDKILGVIAAVNVAGYAAGAPLGNICFDIFGSYVPFIWVSAGLMVVVTVMYQFIINAANKNRAEVLAAEQGGNSNA